MEATRVHNQLSPNVTYIEDDFPEAVRELLRDAGEKLEVSEINTNFTSVQAIRIRKEAMGKQRRICAVADSRKDGAPSGE